MNKTILVDTRLKSRTESLMDYSQNGIPCFLVKFKDIDDSFWFRSEVELYDFLERQASERFYDSELKKGYFDYVNENNEMIRYYITVNRGSIISYRDENMGVKEVG